MKLSEALGALALPCLAQSCLDVSGMISNGFETQFEVTTVDNGAQTCDFTCSGDINDCTGTCVAGYSGKITTDTNYKSYFTINYCNPDNCYTLQVDTTGDINEGNCCGGDAPCVCWQVNYSGSFFGC